MKKPTASETLFHGFGVGTLKFPTITYGPPHPIDQPGPESVKINESLTIMEFISDLYPHAGLVPKEPIEKAKARVFVSFMESVIMPIVLGTIFIGTKDISELYTAFDFVQSRLPDDSQYAIGNSFTIADIAAVAIFSMVEVVLSNDLGIYKQGEGLKVYEVYKSAKYDKLRGYVTRLLDRPSVKSSFYYVSSQFHFAMR